MKKIPKMTCASPDEQGEVKKSRNVVRKSLRGGRDSAVVVAPAHKTETTVGRGHL